LGTKGQHATPRPPKPLIWRVAANILNKQPTRDGPPAWGVGRDAKISPA
jgi:hypothetical protein